MFARLTVLGATLASLTLLAADGLSWREGLGHRAAPVRPAPGARPVGFTLLAPAQTGVTFTNHLAQSRYVTNQIYLNGAGVAAGDFDSDGWCDLFFAGIDRPNALYRNLGGWRFEDVTERAGVALPGKSCSGVTFADLDGDGDLDLVVNSVGNGTFLLVNDGRGRFELRAPDAPLNYLRAGMTAALADVDGDGDLDLYVSNYRTTTIRDMPNTRMRLREVEGGVEVVAVNDRPVTEADLVGRFTATREGRIVENGEPDVLYLNDGRGGFTLVPFTGGAFVDEDGRPPGAPLYDWGLTATFRDLNADGAPDLYVCNDFDAPDRIWLNDGRGRFRALPRLALRQTSIFSMGVDFADINRDGHLDFFVSDMLSRDHARRMLENGEIQPVHLPPGLIENRPQYSHNTLLVNRGDLTFAELSQFAGVEASEWTWSPNFLDVDLDGYEDLLITTGHELQMMNTDIIEQAETLKTQRVMSNHELQRLRTMFPRYAIPNVVFRNRGDLGFEDVSAAWGFDFPDVGNAVALADLDNDGDLDVVVNNLNGVAELCRNEATAPRLLVRLRGQPPNTQGIGAQVIVRGGPVPEQRQEIICGGRYLSGAEPARMFAAGPAGKLSIEVIWRGGRRSRVADAKPDHIYEIVEPADGPVTPPAPPPAKAPLFADRSAWLGHRHVEEPFDDFQRQPLLPRKLSQLGPGVSWADVNGDGWDDLLVAGGRGGALGVFLNQAGQGFVARTNAPLNKPNARDQTTVLAFDSALLVGASNYEDGLTSGGALRVFDLQAGVSGEAVLGRLSSTGPLAAADVDGDGDLDVFLGGRAVPGRYPEPADSVLLRKDGPRLVPAQRFEKLGLVSGAVFSDLNSDGAPDLVLACDWGPLRIFRNDGGQLVPWDPSVRGEAAQPAAGPRLSAWTGWWTGVATGDVDGDGRPDIVAANWGCNSRYRPTLDQPVRIHYGDLDENGLFDVIETYINPANGQEVPMRGLRPVREAIPLIQARVASFEAYGRASVRELYGDHLADLAVVSVVERRSMLLLNRGEAFELRPLPPEARWAPAFGVCVADFEGDGREDVFLSQNFFAVNPDEWRQDAGRGLLLLGDGQGGFRSVPGQESGVRIYGEQRGCAAADFDGDGRLDLAVSQNANATVLLQNASARPGLRVRVAGPPGNPHGVGAAVRLKAGKDWGPLREAQAGSGYWSQNSATLVLATPAPPTQIWIRWPGGRTQELPLPADAREVLVQPDGTVSRVR
jgi:hypothetical protein